MENKIKNRVDVAEMLCLRNKCSVTRGDRGRNEKIRRRCRLQGSLSEKGKQQSCGCFDILKNGGREICEKIYIKHTGRVIGREVD